jgi:hypothetical protein
MPSIIKADNISNLSNDKLQIDLLNSNISYNNNVVGKIGNGFGGFTGNVIQESYTELTTSGATSSVNIPVDNTIPQNTEGAEILTCSITPKYTNSILFIESNIFLGESSNVSNGLVMALFRDTNTNAISTSYISSDFANSVFGATLTTGFLYLKARDISNTVSPITYRIRVGGGNTNTAVRWNGVASQIFNGTLISYIKISEIQQ